MSLFFRLSHTQMFRDEKRSKRKIGERTEEQGRSSHHLRERDKEKEKAKRQCGKDQKINLQQGRQKALLRTMQKFLNTSYSVGKMPSN